MTVYFTRPISVHEARKIGLFLAKYEISVRRARVAHEDDDGWWEDRPLTFLIMENARAAVSALPAAMPLGFAVASVTAAAVNPIGIVVMAGINLILDAALYRSYVRNAGEASYRIPLRSKVSVDFSSLGDRIGWAEFLFCSFSAHEFSAPMSGELAEKTMKTMMFPSRMAAASRHNAKYGRPPVPWGEK